jgi:hypothetical protein
MNNRDVITFQSRMSSGAERVMSIEADEAANVATELLQQLEQAESREEGDNAKVAIKLGRGVATKVGASSRQNIKHPIGSNEHGAQRVERAMEVLSARNQRHKRRVRIQVLVSDLTSSSAGGKKARGGWHTGVEEKEEKHPVARAMLHGWCCGFDVENQDKMKAKAQGRMTGGPNISRGGVELR